MNDSYYRRCDELSLDATAFVTVTLIAGEGSIPQDVGSKMIVTAAGLEHGTVGGGRVETAAIKHAQLMLSQSKSTDLIRWNLNTDLGMTCGGRVEFFFERIHTGTWPIAIFGAGHVAQALTRLLTSLPCQVTCIDDRTLWLDRLPDAIQRICLPDPAEAVATLPEETYVVCMTQGHRTDLPILQAIGRSRRVFPFLGVIGSKTKAGVLRRELRQSGIENPELAFHCPVGLPIGTNHVGEIAVSIAAQLLQVRDENRTSS